MSRLTLIFAKGTAPSKWCDRFTDRGLGEVDLVERDDPYATFLDTPSAVALVRLPDPRIEQAIADGVLHRVALYEEAPGIVVPKDSELTLLEEISETDIDGLVCHYRPTPGVAVDVAAVREAVMVVAANVGVACAPRPLLRSVNNKDTEHRPFTDGVPTPVVVVWRQEDDCDLIQDFVGIMRGRTPRSSRQQQPKLTASQKAKAKAARRQQQAGGEASRGGSYRKQGGVKKGSKTTRRKR